MRFNSSNPGKFLPFSAFPTLDAESRTCRTEPQSNRDSMFLIFAPLPLGVACSRRVGVALKPLFPRSEQKGATHVARQKALQR